MNFSSKNITSIICLILAATMSLQSQELNEKNLVEKIVGIKRLTTISVQQDSIEVLAKKIARQNTSISSVLYKTMDSLLVDEQLKLPFYFEWATSISRSGDVSLSKKLRKKELKMARNTGHIIYESEALNSLSSLYISLSKTDSVAYYNILADKLIKENTELLGHQEWQIYYRYAGMYELLGDLNSQKKSLEKSWKLINEKPDHQRRGFLIYALLDFYRQTNDELNQAKFTELFLQHYNKRKLNTPDYHFPLEIIFLKDDSPASLTNLVRINKLSDSLHNLNALSQTTITLASRLIESGRSQEAIPYLTNCIKKLTAANYPISNSSEWFLLQQAYKETGQYKNAYEALASQKMMEDSIRSATMLSKIANYEVKYETEKKDSELQKLNFEAEKSKQQQLLYTIALISGGVILTILAVFFYRNKKKNILLAKQKKMLEITVDEKNVLLKETHHRVKNSFQIVSSLLYLQSENIKDKQAQAAMKEAQNRVRSMVLIHQRLYSKDQLVGVSTDEYLMDLVHDIFESHQAETEKVTYTIDATPIILGIEATTSLGLILNELITNVIKHAFPKNHAKGSMHVSFQQEKETLVLQVTDTGLGMPDVIKETSFGIELITALAKKLKAKLEFTPNSPQGTIATLIIHRFVAL